jgi:hypothetical protein
MHLRAGLDDMEKRKFLIIPGLELRPLRHPASSQSLYRLIYPGWIVDARPSFTISYAKSVC